MFTDDTVIGNNNALHIIFIVGNFFRVKKKTLKVGIENLFFNANSGILLYDIKKQTLGSEIALRYVGGRLYDLIITNPPYVDAGGHG